MEYQCKYNEIQRSRYDSLNIIEKTADRDVFLNTFEHLANDAGFIALHIILFRAFINIKIKRDNNIFQFVIGCITPHTCTANFC